MSWPEGKHIAKRTVEVHLQSHEILIGIYDTEEKQQEWPGGEIQDKACKRFELNVVRGGKQKFFKQNELLKSISQKDPAGPKLGNGHRKRNHWQETSWG